MKRILASLVLTLMLALGAFGQSSYPSTLVYGSTIVGVAAPTQISTFTNSAAVTITGISVSVTTGSSDFSVVTNPATNCGGSLATGLTCTLTVTFTPSVLGARNGVITISWAGSAGSPFYVYLAGNGQLPGSSILQTTLGAYQGTTVVGETDAAFHVLGGPITIPAGAANYVGKRLHVRGSGVYTNASTTPLLSLEVSFCTVSGCGSGTVMTPAGAVFTSTAGGLVTNGQFNFDYVFTVATTGASATGMAKGSGCFNLTTATTGVLSCFQDTATALSAAVDLTVTEYIQTQFKFSVANAGNSATLNEATAEFLN